MDPEPLEIFVGTNISVGVSGSSPGHGASQSDFFPQKKLQVLGSQIQALQSRNVLGLMLASLEAVNFDQFHSRSLQCSILSLLDK